MPTLILHIRPDGAQSYQARVFEGKVLLGSPTIHAQVAAAIEAYGEEDCFPQAAAFDIWYGGSSVRAVPRALMRTDAIGLAGRLLLLSLVQR